MTDSFKAISNLVKFRLSAAVTFSAITGFLIASREPAGLLITAAGVFLLASGAAALNQYSERSFDEKMSRTAARPLPGRKLIPGLALLTALILILSGSLLLLLRGIVPAALGILNIVLYNFVYTRLKPVSWIAIFPGALVGAVPPLIGFTAAGGSELSPGIALLSSFMFLWQIPHFWLILLKYRNEYKEAGFKPLPELMDEKSVRILVFCWVIITSILLLVFSVAELVFNRYVSMALVPLNLIFIYLFFRELFVRIPSNSSRAFIIINSFSLIVLILFIINSFLS